MAPAPRIARIYSVVAGVAAVTVSMAQSATGQGVPPIVLHNDSSLKAVLGMRMQDRFTYLHTAGAGQQADAADFQVRRFRLRMEGHAITPRLQYKVQLGLSDRDVSIGDGATSVLMDAMVLYQAGKNTRLGFGQGKLPGGRLALISSGAMELPERALANGAFTAERDRGIQLEQAFPAGKQALHVHLAASQGEGRSGQRGAPGSCYTGRLEWMPFGEFRGNGAYTEGDLEREPAPKLALAAAYSTDRNALRARAQNGPLLPDGQARTIGTFYADAMFKYRGWAWLCEFDRRLAHGDPWAKDTATHVSVAVNEGWGITNQASRMVGKRSQLAVRHSMVRYDATVRPAYDDRDEVLLGWSYFLHDHRIKLQSAVLYEWGEGDADLSHAGNQFGFMFQVELGI